MGNNPSNHQPLERANVSRFGDVNASRRSFRSPRKMDRLRRSFRDSFRKRKDRVPESSKPHQWQADEAAVRSGTCTFAVKYLGCVEVFESRGMQVCEEALKVLRASRRRPIRAVLHVSGDGLRVVEDETKGLIVDQTIEKVSFCAPDRNHERGFSYICRDGTTRRWMCHGFLALRESGERLSHAVGCAFAACLERKQRRDKECGVTMTFDQANSTFTRTGSFRQQSITERFERSASIVDVPQTPKAPPVNPFAIERPHATPHMLERQGSFRGLSQLGNNSPFKRQMSLRVNELPSNAERLRAFLGPVGQTNGANGMKSVSPIPEISPGDSVTALCQQLSQGLSQLTHSGSDDFNFNSQTSINQNVSLTMNTILSTGPADVPTTSNINSISSINTATVTTTAAAAAPSTPASLLSDFNSVHVSTTPARPVTSVTPVILNYSPIISGSSNNIISRTTPSSLSNRSPNPSIDSIASSISTGTIGNILPKPEQWLGQIVNSTTPPMIRDAESSSSSSIAAAAAATTTAVTVTGTAVRRTPMIGPHSRTMSLGSAESFGRLPQVDPFDAEWAAIATRQNTIHPNNNNNTNPFLVNTTTTTTIQQQPFQVQL